jgi:hypothetical protein
MNVPFQGPVAMKIHDEFLEPTGVSFLYVRKSRNSEKCKKPIFSVLIKPGSEF